MEYFDWGQGWGKTLFLYQIVKRAQLWSKRLNKVPKYVNYSVKVFRLPPESHGGGGVGGQALASQLCTDA